MRGGRGGEPHRISDVARPVRIRLIGRPLSAGKNDRLIRTHEEIGHVRALLHRVSPMSCDGAAAIAFVQLFVDACGKRKSQMQIKA